MFDTLIDKLKNDIYITLETTPAHSPIFSPIIEKIADLIKSGEISINDLEGAVDKGEMTLGDLERIKAEIQSDNQLSQDIEQEFSDVDQGRKLSDEQIQQIAQGLQSGQIKEEEIQQALQSGQLTQADVEAIQQAMQSEENSDQSQDQNQGLYDYFPIQYYLHLPFHYNEVYQLHLLSLLIFPNH